MIDGVTILILFALLVAAIVLERPARNARSLVPLQLFRPDLGSCLPVQETSIARRGPRGSTETYVTKYVAGSAPGAGNVARRS